ncbi:uridine-cytidine kinase B [Sphaeroforma arctica JP610]|uniref:uridine/cytidine kinase n=1 Tax=Sphaeroforma arctica JP610 TaxID=667725 RepID=A0A0L0GEX6_9EUKA|nr:uridine-cytidine kinase B [Sphaeroforma arctica JP610]KNC87421.1 uridine-cytidine kinase B [Sphaeroforma arctica JP610]|eukprot:XP_014161323.1 uridine-cytidine kinase B [Sphaeroforma arctica JP610]
MEQLQHGNEGVAVLIHQDSFYKTLDKSIDVSTYNFDHPDAFDLDEMNWVLRELSEGRSVDLPKYNFKTHSRMEETERLNPAKIILLEGIMSFYTSALRETYDMKLFVDCDDDERLGRRVLRDIQHRGRDLDGVLRQYIQYVKPSFEDFILPTKKYADVIIPRGASNHVAIDLIVEHIKEQEQSQGQPKLANAATHVATPRQRPH